MSTEAQAAWKLLDAAAAGTLNLDATDVDTPSNVAPAAEPAAVVTPETEEVEGDPIAAKSGSYTIPYEKLFDRLQKCGYTIQNGREKNLRFIVIGKIEKQKSSNSIFNDSVGF